MSRRLFGIVVLALALAACGKGDNNGGGAAGEDSVKTGPGTTADTITLGYLPDLSGVFAPNGKAMMEGANLYWDAKNEAGASAVARSSWPSRTPATTRRRRSRRTSRCPAT